MGSPRTGSGAPRTGNGLQEPMCNSLFSSEVPAAGGDKECRVWPSPGSSRLAVALWEGLCGHLPIHQLATVDRTSGIISAYLVEKQC